MEKPSHCKGLNETERMKLYFTIMCESYLGRNKKITSYTNTAKDLNEELLLRLDRDVLARDAAEAVFGGKSVDLVKKSLLVPSLINKHYNSKDSIRVGYTVEEDKRILVMNVKAIADAKWQACMTNERTAAEVEHLSLKLCIHNFPFMEKMTNGSDAKDAEKKSMQSYAEDEVSWEYIDAECEDNITPR